MQCDQRLNRCVVCTKRAHGEDNSGNGEHGTINHLDLRLLMCLHSICHECIARETKQGGWVRCPMCGEETSIEKRLPRNHIPDLFPSTRLRCCEEPGVFSGFSCLTCEEDLGNGNLCTKCLTVHRQCLQQSHQLRKMQSFNIREPDAIQRYPSLAAQDPIPLSCHKHPYTKANYFCLGRTSRNECNVWNCSSCQLEHSSNKHSYTTLQEYTEKSSGSLRERLKVQDLQRKQFEELQAKLASRTPSMSNTQIRSRFQLIRDALEEAEDLALARIHQTIVITPEIKQFFNGVLAQLDQVLVATSVAKSCVEGIPSDPIGVVKPPPPQASAATMLEQDLTKRVADLSQQKQFIADTMKKQSETEEKCARIGLEIENALSSSTITDLIRSFGIDNKERSDEDTHSSSIASRPGNACNNTCGGNSQNDKKREDSFEKAISIQNSDGSKVINSDEESCLTVGVQSKEVNIVIDPTDSEVGDRRFRRDPSSNPPRASAESSSPPAVITLDEPPSSLSSCSIPHQNTTEKHTAHFPPLVNESTIGRLPNDIPFLEDDCCIIENPETSDQRPKPQSRRVPSIASVTPVITLDDLPIVTEQTYSGSVVEAGVVECAGLNSPGVPSQHSTSWSRKRKRSSKDLTCKTNGQDSIDKSLKRQEVTCGNDNESERHSGAENLEGILRTEKQEGITEPQFISGPLNSSPTSTPMPNQFGCTEQPASRYGKFSQLNFENLRIILRDKWMNVEEIHRHFQEIIPFNLKFRADVQHIIKSSTSFQHKFENAQLLYTFSSDSEHNLSPKSKAKKRKAIPVEIRQGRKIYISSKWLEKARESCLREFPNRPYRELNTIDQAKAFAWSLFKEMPDDVRDTVQMKRVCNSEYYSQEDDLLNVQREPVKTILRLCAEEFPLADKVAIFQAILPYLERSRKETRSLILNP